MLGAGMRNDYIGRSGVVNQSVSGDMGVCEPAFLDIVARPRGFGQECRAAADCHQASAGSTTSPSML